MSLLEAARAAADRAQAEHRADMQRKLAGLLVLVLGEEYARQARYVGRGKDVLAEIEGLYFAEFRNGLHVYAGLSVNDHPWDGEKVYKPLSSLAALGDLGSWPLDAAQRDAEWFAQYKALPELSPLPGESAGEPE